MSKSTLIDRLLTVLVIGAVVAFAACFALAEDIGSEQQGVHSPEPVIKHLPPTRVMIDEDVLAAFVDEPCRHFEAARDTFVARQFRQTAGHLRTATAFLRLEAARANAQGRVALDASIRELYGLAHAVENTQIRSVEVLHRAFARAHYALAGHHCIKSAHRCCQPKTYGDRQQAAHASHDLRASTVHLERGSQWAGTDLDQETRQAIQASRAAADKLKRGNGLQANVQLALQRLHEKMEGLTGRKVMLAQPLTPDNDTMGPSIFH